MFFDNKLDSVARPANGEAATYAPKKTSFLDAGRPYGCLPRTCDPIVAFQVRATVIRLDAVKKVPPSLGPSSFRHLVGFTKTVITTKRESAHLMTPKYLT